MILNTLVMLGVCVTAGWLLGIVAMTIADRVIPSKGNTERQQ